LKDNWATAVACRKCDNDD